jgi:hypothetical protein
MPPNQPSQYDFIMSSSAKPKRQFNFGNSTGSRIALVLIGLTLIIVAVVVVNSLFSKDQKAQAQRLTEIVQTQSEIIRVSGLAKDKAKDIKTRNYALTTRLSVESSQLQVKKSLAGRGVSSKSVNKKLGVLKNPKTDAVLIEAGKNNRFDDTFYAVINKQLEDYQKLVKTAYDNGTPAEKKTLDLSFQNAARLKTKTVADSTSPTVQ